jgi:acyl carrier protein
MDDGVLLDRLRGVITRVVGATRIPADVSADTGLADGGLWLDSMDLLQVVLASEVEFGITFKPAEDLLGGGLETLRTFAELIRRRSPDLPAAGSASAPSR